MKIVSRLKIVLISALILFGAINVSAQNDDKTVTLVVSGQGKTQDEAKQNALRSAIEQAFGTFISSKTEILNDNLVKDEIVSLANGNIQKFEIISEVQIPNGDYATSLKATVSVTKLTSFIESKGVVVEFKGNILAANVKQQMLNEQNETKSIGNIVVTCKEILDLSCDFSIVRGEPKQKNNDNNNWSVPITINVKFNKNIEQFNQYLLNSIKAIAMSQDEVSQYNQLGKKTYKIILGNSSIGGRTTDINFLESLSFKNTNLHFRIIHYGDILFESSDIKKIKKEVNNLIKKGHPKINFNHRYQYEIEYYNESINPVYYFRTMSAVISIIDLIYYSKHSVLNFQITNNLNLATPEKLIADYKKYKNDRKGYSFIINFDNLSPIFNASCINSPGIFSQCHDNGQITNDWGGFESISVYKPITEYRRFFYFNSFDWKQIYTQFSKILNTKYGFIFKVETDFHEKCEANAVISLFDFKADGNNVITFYYEDFLTLADVEKVQEYKIIPISKN